MRSESEGSASSWVYLEEFRNRTPDLWILPHRARALVKKAPGRPPLST